MKISIRNGLNSKTGLHDLCNLIKSKYCEPITLIEIGSYVGDSSIIFAQHFNKVICIDPWLNGYDDTDPSSYTHDMTLIEREFDLNTKKYSNIIKVKEYSSNYSKEIVDRSIDIVYIDGIHTYSGCKEDIINYLPKIKKGGFITGHDYDTKKFQGVVDAVDEFFKKPDIVFLDSSWLVQIN